MWVPFKPTSALVWPHIRCSRAQHSLVLASRCHHFLLNSLVSQRCRTIGGRMEWIPGFPRGVICKEVICANTQLKGWCKAQLTVTAVPSKNAAKCTISLSLLLGINPGVKLDCHVQLCVAMC